MTDERLLAGRYRLDRTIGRGGMAEVHRAHDELLDRYVAIKLLLPRFADDEQFVARFRREAQAAASLNHPNVVGVYDTGNHDGRPFIVMELVRGRSLQQAIAAGGLTEDRALEVCAEVCSALAYAHSRGLVHRDVKPGNIMLAEDGTVKVTDFGIARALDSDTVTQTAAVLGTAAYLSPEQAQALPVDARSDLYSLGVVLYEVLTHQQPFRGDSAITVAYQHVQELPRPPRDWDESISTAAEAIAVRAMAKNPANRYASAEEMRDDLLRARVGEAVDAPAVLRAEDTAMLDVGTAPSERITRVETQERSRRVVGFVVLGLFSLAAAAAAVWYLGTLFSSEETQRISVPTVVGESVTEAQRILRSRGLEVAFDDPVTDPEVPVNSVVRQDPSPGELVAEGSTVTLTLSAGRQQVEVPDVVDRPLDEAKRLIREAGLVPGEERRESSDEVPEGNVISTTPPAGSEIPTGRPVDLVISSGEELVRVPNVVGLTESDARFELRDRDFEILVLQRFSDTVDEGLVIEQSPGPGEQLPSGSEVTIVVSQGPQEPASPSPSPSPSPTDEPTDEPTDVPSPAPSPTES